MTVLYGRLAEIVSKKLILSINTVSYVFSVLYFLAVCKFLPIMLFSTFSDAREGEPLRYRLLLRTIKYQDDMVILYF